MGLIYLDPIYLTLPLIGFISLEVFTSHHFFLTREEGGHFW
jgi:hypothetical protein